MKTLLALLATLCLVASASAHEGHAAGDMAFAAGAFLASLDADQKAMATFEFESDHRHDWAFVPQERKGLPIKEMTADQRYLLNALLASGLSNRGLIKANTIMSLESVLAILEGPDRRFPRDPEMYFISLFGEPGGENTWGWRFEGHHLSLSFTIVNGEAISATPSFFGTNPGIILEGPRAGLQTADLEENLGRQLVQSLSEEQLNVALISNRAPRDIITGADRKVDPLENVGIKWQQLNEEQQVQLWDLIRVYVERARGEIAEADLTKIDEAGREHLVFAWAGGVEPRQGHYYRIQGPTFLIEYDNTQNDANHVHAVYRDFEEDFGEDLLKAHYEEAH